MKKGITEKKKSEKYKLWYRILAYVGVFLVAFLYLTVPISAIVNSSQGSYMDFDLTAMSTFPLTVGFSYVTRDPDTGVGNTYVYATEVGGYGEEWNSTLFGQDDYTQNYVPAEGVEYELAGSLTYNFVERVWNDADSITWVDGQYTSTVRRGHQLMSMMNVSPSGGNIVGHQQGVVLRASDVVYNPIWFQASELAAGVTDNPMLPTFQTPSVEDPSSQAVVLTYSWRCSIISQGGNQYDYSGVEVYDTRDDNATKMIPIIPISVLREFKDQSTIIISDYYGFLDVDHYENIAVEDDPLAGTWLFNVPSTFFDTTLGNMVISGHFYGVDQNYDISLLPIDHIYWGYFTSDGTSSFNCYDAASFPQARTTFNSGRDTITFRYYVEGEDQYEIFVENTDALFDTYRTVTIDTSYSESVAENGSSETAELLTRLQSSATKLESTDEGSWQEVDSSGDGYLFRFTYPLYDTSGVVITESNVFNESWKLFGTPTMQKYLSTKGEVPTLDYNADYTGWIADAVGGFLNFEVFPNFTFGGILGILVSFSFMMLFLKFFAGG